MNTDKIYDIIGIGIGPFNLGLAALAADIPQLECIFIDKQEHFNWHPGLLLPTAKIQVPFYADLVTLANPCSRFSYLAYLKSIGRLFKFAINETHFPYRSEFNAYCKWVVAQLSSLHFGYHCKNVTYDASTKIYSAFVRQRRTGMVQQLHAKHIAIGTGTVPHLPSFVKESKSPLISHSSNYLHLKESLLRKKKITIVGSGQSAAEIFIDLLPHLPNLESLHWYTRSSRFHPMEYSKLTLEMNSPEYINHFFNLDSNTKKSVLQQQQYLYQGINATLIDEIYAQLYLMDLNKDATLPVMHTNSELLEVALINQKQVILKLKHTETGAIAKHETEAVILATGYTVRNPIFQENLNGLINWNDKGKISPKKNYSVDARNTIFLQNAELHTHGFNSADLGLGPYRNAVILNTILKAEHFKVEDAGNVFQQFH